MSDMNESYEYHFERPEGEEPFRSNYTPEPQRQPEKKRGGVKVAALALCCALLGGAIGAGGFALGSAAGAKDPAESSTTVLLGQRENTVIDLAHVDTGKELSQAEVYALNVNSTVGITTSITTNFWGYQTKSAASGSGFILTQDGYILTNAHVIEDSDSITVTLYDGSSYDAALVGYDESNDIAVLKIEAQGLPPVILGDSDNINVGDPVVAIGNPLGELTFSLTSGSVSALDRAVTLESGVTMDLMQTDCAINAGNSGGALFNLHGEVIGITNAKYSGNSSSGEASIDNIGFAIPINQVQSIVKSIIEDGYIIKPYIGVTVQNVSDEARNYGLPAGAAIASVTEDGPAAQAGLQANDIITAVNGNEIADKDNLVDIVGAAQAGDKLTLTVYRQGETLELTVTVGEQRQEALPQKQEDSQDASGGRNNSIPSGGYPGSFNDLIPWFFGG